MSKGYTVIGYWDDSSCVVVTGVVLGQHAVEGGATCSEGGPYAVYVEAPSAEEAEEQINGMSAYDDEDMPNPENDPRLHTNDEQEN